MDNLSNNSEMIKGMVNEVTANRNEMNACDLIIKVELGHSCSLIREVVGRNW